MRGKTHSYRGVFINAEVKSDLSWLALTIPRAIGVQFVDIGLWHDGEADIIIWTDASLRHALAFMYSGNGFVYQLSEPPSNQKVDIFFLELIAILSTIHHCAPFPSPPKRLLVYTDSLDAVGSLNSLRTSESLHNGPLLAIAGIILNLGVDLRVCHIVGKTNIHADLLSRLLFEEYSFKFSSDHIRTFIPPCDLLPARWRECF